MTARTSQRIFGLLALGLLYTCAGGPAQDPRPYLLDRVGDTAIVQLYADGFDDLSLSDKILCFHLANAAIAGRDIFLDQKFRYNLPIRNILEPLYLVQDQLDPDTALEIARYTKLFWVHNGIHNSITTRKELLDLDWETFLNAVEMARLDGANMPEDELLSELHSVMTDPATYLSVTNKSPGDGKDPLVESSNNLYVNVTTADLQGFEEKNPLNSKLVKEEDGTLVEKVYRAGDGQSIPAGLYAPQLTRVIGHLEKAIPHAPEATQKALKLLIRYYQTGEFADWHAFNIAWVQDGDSVVDQINGFVEVYLDARGQKGSWEAVVSFRKETTRSMEVLAEEAQWFEDRMPWEDRFKRKSVPRLTATVITVVTETGDSGPVSPIGINLPNEADIRQDYGSKSVNLSNVVEAYENASAGSSADEFALTPEEVERSRLYRALSGDMHTNLHEVVGHASGQVLPEVGNPADKLGTYYSTLEEGRADLIALYWISDPKLQELGLIPNDDAALAEYEGYTRNALVQLRRVPEGGQVEEDHMRNRQMIIHWLLDFTDAVVIEKRDGKTYYRVTSAEAFREGCGLLLAEVMRMKATGDLAAAKTLIDAYGTRVDPTLHREVRDRIANLNLPSTTGFVQPELRAVTDSDGNITNVEVFYPLDIAAQMLRWSGAGR